MKATGRLLAADLVVAFIAAWVDASRLTVAGFWVLLIALLLAGACIQHLRSACWGVRR